MYLNHRRTSTYIDDTVRTLANIGDEERFKPGEVYNIGGGEYHDIKGLSDMILRNLGKDDRLVSYKDAEGFTTRDKKVDVSRAERDLDLRATVPLEVGIKRTIEWQRKVYLHD